MSADLERRYARLLGAYPAGYRHEHQQEILATLLDSAHPGQRHPSVREAAALAVGGLRTRARLAARQSPWSLWAEGLRLGVLLLLVSVTASAASATWLLTEFIATWITAKASGWVLSAAAALALVAVARGRFRAGLALRVVAIAAGWSSPPTQPELLALVVAAAILLVLLWRPPAPSRRRAWPWLLATPLSLLVGLYGFHLGDRWPMVTAWEVRSLAPNLAVVAVALAWASIDPRVTIAAAVYVAPRLLGYLSTTLAFGVRGLGVWDVIVPLAIAAVVGILLATGGTRARRLTRRWPQR
jgi:hypothetical protein